MQTGEADRSRDYPPLPHGLTSFGAAVCGEGVYLYGGHLGEAHTYWRDGQSDELLRLDLTRPAAWELVGRGPRLQGAGLVAYNGGLYRVGGFEARNEHDAPQMLYSVTEFARGDAVTGSWEQLPPLPDARSSHDAVLLDDQLLVVGGWTLCGAEEPRWPSTVWRYDLRETSGQWEALPDPGFTRRALAAAAWNHRLVVIGGMQEEGGPTGRTAIFDPTSGGWLDGPDLPGPPMQGFGAAACVAEGQLFVSTSSGQLLRLSDTADRWELVARLRDARFFHRLVPVPQGMLAVGGTHMERGKFLAVEHVGLPPSPGR